MALVAYVTFYLIVVPTLIILYMRSKPKKQSNVKRVYEVPEPPMGIGGVYPNRCFGTGSYWAEYQGSILEVGIEEERKN